MADLSFSETQTVFEDQKRTIGQLRERLAEKELQVIEGETLRKKLHNTILVNGFCLKFIFTSS
jgi:kinesin family member C1